MTSQYHEMATLAGRLEDKYGEIQAQSVLEKIEETQYENNFLEFFEIQSLSNLIREYRKVILQQIKEFKLLREQKNMPVSIYHKLKEMNEQIKSDIARWTELRDDFFLQRACLAEHHVSVQNGFANGYARPSSMPRRRRA